MVDRLGLPMMIKPDQGGSALGARLVREETDLPSAMVDCLAYGTGILAEQYIEGMEVAISVVADPEPRTLPVVEIVPKSGVYDYASRYTPGATSFPCPARVPAPVLADAERSALEVHELLGLRDLSRTDAIIASDGTVYVLEVATCPGLTETSLLPTAMAASGETLGDLFGSLIDESIRRTR
jgi:D-alanine-D-alanine ligase